MNMNINEFDDLMKDKLNEKEYSFSESNWEKAAKMIDASRPAKKPLGGLFWAAAIVGSIGLLTGGVYFFSHSGDAKNQLAKNSVAIIKQEDKTTNEITKEKIEEANNLNNTDTKGIQNNSVNSLQVESNPASSEGTNENIVEVQRTTESTKSINDKTAGRSNLNIKNTKINSTASNLGVKAKSTEKGTSDSFAKNNESRVEENKEPAYNKENVVNQVYAEDLTPEYIQQLAINKVSGEEETIPEANCNADYSSLEVLNNDYVKLKRHTLNIEAGAINSLGWKVNNKRNGNSLTPVFGINYIHNFTAKSSVLVGVQYNTLSNITESNVSFSITSYGFGKSSDITTYKITELQYLVLPVKYIHKVGKNSYVGAGLNLSYLLNTKNRIEVYSSEDNNMQQIATFTDNGYGKGITQNYNAQIALSYTHKFTKRIGMNVELNRTIRNVFTDYSAFSIENVSNKPTSIKFTLTYTLFNK
ncbi:MAG: hypothetical protein JNM96_06645 [Bacteroidia bacterium]|nr:hypothetical protein [Bacteroidia bacterium]